MLELAFNHKRELCEAYRASILTERVRYLNIGPHLDWELKIEDNSWSQLAYVSISDSGKILGFFSATLSRENNKARNVTFISFTDEISLVFAYDFREFWHTLFTKFGIRKVEFDVVVGNPAEHMYDRWITRHGGHIIGVFKETVMLYDGKLYDRKFYEIFREEYLANSRMGDSDFT